MILEMLLQRSVELIAPASISLDNDIEAVRTVQAASFLLTLTNGRMPFGRLMLMLYLADREAYRERARPITYDSYAATVLGPIPIVVVRWLLTNRESGQAWRQAIERVGEDAQLRAEIPTGRLSKHDRLVLRRAFDEIDGLEVSSKLERLAELLSKSPDRPRPNGLTLPFCVFRVFCSENSRVQAPP